MKMRILMSSLVSFAIMPSTFAGAFVNAGGAGQTIIPQTGFVEIIGAFGGSTGVTGTTYLGVSSTETDALVQSDVGKGFATGQVGVGYVQLLSPSGISADTVQVLPSVEYEVNGYYTPFKLTGDVDRFGSSSFNEFSYDMNVKSSRLMFDTEVTIASYKAASVFGVAGLGASWNRVSYHETSNGNSSCTTGLAPITVDPDTTASFAYEFGGGLKFAITPKVRLSVEYLYSHLAKLKVGDTGHSSDVSSFPVVPADFSLHSNAVLAGLHVAL